MNQCRLAAFRVFCVCWLVYTAFWTPYVVREHFPALALVERASMNVERYAGWTDDIFPGPRGGAYINNNPGASLTGAIPLLLLRPLFRRMDQWNQKLPRPAQPIEDGEVFTRALREGRALYLLLVAFATVALVMAPATAGVMAFLCWRIIESGVPPRGAAGAAILCGVGTPLLFRAGLLNHNLLVADAGFVALLLLWDPRGRPLGAGRAAVAGLLAGYTLLCDYSGIVVIAAVAVYVWVRAPVGSARWSVAAAFTAGLAPGVLGLFGYQEWAFGSFYRPPQHYMAPTAPTSQGYRGFDWPSPALAWALLFDPRFGLFAYCPALILAAGAPFVRHVKYRMGARERWLLLGYSGLFVLFCSANQYSWLQPLTGFRYLVPVVPGLALLAMETAQALPRGVRWTIAGLSLLQALLITAAHENDLRLTLPVLWQQGFRFPWMMRLGEAGMPPVWVNAMGIAALCALALAAFYAWIAVMVPHKRVFRIFTAF